MHARPQDRCLVGRSDHLRARRWPHLSAELPHTSRGLARGHGAPWAGDQRDASRASGSCLLHCERFPHGGKASGAFGELCEAISLLGARSLRRLWRGE